MISLMTESASMFLIALTYAGARRRNVWRDALNGCSDSVSDNSRHMSSGNMQEDVGRVHFCDVRVTCLSAGADAMRTFAAEGKNRT